VWWQSRRFARGAGSEAEFLGWTEEELEYYERHQTLPTETQRRRLLIVG
jgi:hypothetical protein